MGENSEKELRPWTLSQTKLLIETRLKHDDEFIAGKRKKSVLWTKVLDEIKEIDNDFPYSRDELIKKFNNLLITFKRIKKRNGESGREATKWDYFDLFNSAYGKKHFVNPPSNMLASSLDCEPEFEANSDEDVSSTPTSTRNAPKKRRTHDISDVLEFLQKQEENEERRHQEQIQVDRERIAVLSGIGDVLEKMLTK